MDAGRFGDLSIRGLLGCQNSECWMCVSSVFMERHGVIDEASYGDRLQSGVQQRQCRSLITMYFDIKYVSLQTHSNTSIYSLQSKSSSNLKRKERTPSQTATYIHDGNQISSTCCLLDFTFHCLRRMQHYIDLWYPIHNRM